MFKQILTESIKAYQDDHAAQLAAAITYHALFALAPCAVIIVAIAGLVVGGDAARDGIAAFITESFGADGARLYASLANSVATPSAGIWTTVGGSVFVLYGAARAFLQFQTALNAVWGVAVRPGTPWWRVVPVRLLPFTLLLVAAVLLSAGLFVDAALNWLASLDLVPSGILGIGPGVQVFVLGIAVFGVFVYSFRVLPDGRIHWQDLMVGAGVATAGLSVVTYLFHFYVVNFGVSSVYGIAGTLVVIVLWINMASQVVLFGAEVAQQYAKEHHRTITSKSYAVRVRRLHE